MLLPVLIIAFFNLTSGLRLFASEKLDHVQVHKVNGHIRQRRSNSFHFPQYLYYKFNLPDGSPVEFNLLKNEELILHTPMKTLENGKLVDVTIDEKENFAVYQDFQRGASIMVMCEDNIHDCKLYGTFYQGKTHYNIQGSEIVHPEAGSTHVISKLDHPLNLEGDTRYLKTKKHTREARSPPENLKSGPPVANHVVEMLFYLDSTVYDAFLNLTANNRDAALEMIKLYYILVLNEVDLMYHSFEENFGTFKIDVMLNEIIIATTVGETPWISASYNSTLDYLDVDVALDTFGDTEVQPNTARYLDFDALMLFSRYDLAGVYGDGSLDKDVIGVAEYDVICDTNPYKAYSLNEDPIYGNVAFVVAHELGHILGSLHDSQIGCNDADDFVMSAFLETPEEKDKSNPWIFSECSQNVIKSKLESVGCTRISTFNQTLFDEYNALKPTGRLYTLDEQCEFAVGAGYIFAESFSNKDTMCYTGITCGTGIGRDATFEFISIRDGSSCGPALDKICYRGSCILDPSLSTTPGDRPTGVTPSPPTPDTRTRDFSAATPDSRTRDFSAATPDTRTRDFSPITHDPRPTDTTVSPFPPFSPNPNAGDCSGSVANRCPKTFGKRQLCREFGGSFCRNYWVC